MGNTPSSSSDRKIRKNQLSISRPMAMGPQSRSLGPDVVTSTTALSEPNHRPRSHHTSHSSINGRTHSRHASLETTSSSSLHAEGGFRPTLRSDASEIRRARSANVSGPSRADRSEELIGAPPPYTTVYIEPSSELHSRLSFDTPQHHGSPTDSESPHIMSAANVRRSASSYTNSTPGFAFMQQPTYPTFGSAFSGEMYSGYDRKGSDLVSEDHGYGVGDGSGPSTIRDHSPSSRSLSDRPLPPVPGSLKFPEPQINIMASPIETRSLSSGSAAGDPLELLKRYDTVFLIDDSSSMQGAKWAEAGEALAQLADIAASYDMEGIDIYFLNNDEFVRNLRDGSAVQREFYRIQPHGTSLLGIKLEELLRAYISNLEKDTNNGHPTVKPVNYIVITDGLLTDDPEDAIVQAARRLDRGDFPVTQVGIQFVQIGDDPQATADLQDLDDALPRQHGIRDMVDFTPYSGTSLTPELLVKILLGGISRRVDKKGAGSVMK